MITSCPFADCRRPSPCVSSRSRPGCCARLGRWLFFFSSRRRHTRWTGDRSSDVCSSDLTAAMGDWFGILPKAGCDVEEIGRASCRKGVDLGGRRIIKKKKKKKIIKEK